MSSVHTLGWCRFLRTLIKKKECYNGQERSWSIYRFFKLLFFSHINNPTCSSFSVRFSMNHDMYNRSSLAR